MLAQRCAWHPKNGHRYRKPLRIAAWWPLWSFEWSDGICRRCAERWLEEIRQSTFNRSKPC